MSQCFPNTIEQYSLLRTAVKRGAIWLTPEGEEYMTQQGWRFFEVGEDGLLIAKQSSTLTPHDKTAKHHHTAPLPYVFREGWGYASSSRYWMTSSGGQGVSLRARPHTNVERKADLAL